MCIFELIFLIIRFSLSADSARIVQFLSSIDEQSARIQKSRWKTNERLEWTVSRHWYRVCTKGSMMKEICVHARHKMFPWNVDNYGISLNANEWNWPKPPPCGAFTGHCGDRHGGDKQQVPPWSYTAFIPFFVCMPNTCMGSDWHISLGFGGLFLRKLKKGESNPSRQKSLPGCFFDK